MREPENQHAVRMSNRQYGQLKYMMTVPKGTIGIDEVSHFNQLTLGGNKRRKFVTETRDKRGIMLTPEGRKAVKAFESADFLRKVSSMHFSSYLNLEAYEAAAPEPKRRRAPVQPMPIMRVVKHRKAS